MKKKRWPLLNNPFGFELPKLNPVIHPIVNSWDDFSEEDKAILSNIKRIIVENIGDCTISIFGSRIKGNWTEDSDYDLVIHKTLSQETLNKIRSIDYGVRTDIAYYPDELPPIESYVEIY